MDGSIEVYSDWVAGDVPRPLGTLRVRAGPQRELCEFSFDERAIASAKLDAFKLDPNLTPFPGAQFPPAGRETFGVFSDSSPDRWGRRLIRRRFERDKRTGILPERARLGESDYLLGVHDLFRLGALRYKRSSDGPFLDDRHDVAAPPFVRLRELEAASRAIESDPDDLDPAGDEWLRLLLAPGSSLGGARPKATVVDPHSRLWIAKFPSVGDDHDVGAWEFVVQRLAERCGLRVPTSDARRFASDEHTFLVERFDRRDGARVHFASAMTLTGRSDGDDAAGGASYLEIAEVIASQGASPREDLIELWSRIAFNVMVSNTDDHLRNHGFLLEPGSGWRLSAAYDMNPVPGSTGLRLNIDESDNARDLDLVRSVAPYFRLSDADASSIIDRFGSVVRGWRELAGTFGLPRRELERMADAFM